MKDGKEQTPCHFLEPQNRQQDLRDQYKMVYTPSGANSRSVSQVGPSSESLVGHDEFNECCTLCRLQQRKRGPNAEHLSEHTVNIAAGNK